MDTELARTFLSVVSAGNFISAANRLHVTQSTVSTRIHSLEERLGCTLFVRNKAGTTLTPAGRQFQKHAAALMRIVERAYQDVGVPRGFSQAITIGGRIGLWDQLLVAWLADFSVRAPQISVRAEIGFEPDLMDGLVEGRIDIGVMYAPQSRPGLKVEPLLEERLVFVATQSDAKPEPGPDYVYVDWGPEFFARHSASFPEFSGPAISVNIGWLGLQHVLATGGAGFFPYRIVHDLIAAGRLTIPEGTPEFVLPAYVVYPNDGNRDLRSTVLDSMRRVIPMLAPPRHERSNGGPAFRPARKAQTRAPKTASRRR
jgi:DNA-binding transcriptional LysR family regulator